MWLFNKKDRESDACEDCADRDWYKEMFVKVLNLSRKERELNKTLLSLSNKLTDKMKEMAEEITQVRKIMKAYSKWDSFIVQTANERDPSLRMTEGPATIYLKSIGEYEDGEYGH
jgi:DNA-binding transcriptional regulator GbsR (MarR family)